MIVLLAAAALWAAAPDPTAERPDVCSVSVKFASVAMGIDQVAFDRVDGYLARDNPLIAGNVVRPWGREGERTVCITTVTRRGADRVFNDMKGLVRGRADRGIIEVRTLEGRVFRVVARTRR